MKMCYLFLAMKHLVAYPLRDSEVLEFSLLKTDKYFSKKYSYDSCIKPNGFVSQIEYQKLGVNKEHSEKSKTFKEVLKKVSPSFKDVNIVVVWSDLEYRLFTKKCMHYKITLPEHRVVVLQDLVKILWGIDSLEYFKDLCNFSQIQPACDTQFTVNKIRLVYRLIRAVYLQDLQQNYRVYWCSNKSLVLHSNECGHSRKVKEKLVVPGESFMDGYNVCKMCAPLLPKIGLEFVDLGYAVWDAFSEDAIQCLCKYYHFDYSIANGVIYIKTAMSSWRIYHDYESVSEVFHQNLRHKATKLNKRKNGINEGFHLQYDLNGKELTEILRYIYFHDKDYLTREHKTKIDKILDEIK